MRPLCPVTVVGPNGSRAIDALVDTGADVSCFPRTLAVELGIDLTRGSACPIVFGSSTSHGIRTTADLIFAGQRRRPDVVWVGDMVYPHPVLGRSGVFSIFGEVAFIERERTPRVEFRWMTKGGLT
ncbi:MAG: retropepsin-like domain-containing protein [Deltaproteobacteria bacterium]|nr:retropepsin-like domain-containing protein [Deltaproteobacteria bacterium]